MYYNHLEETSVLNVWIFKKKRNNKTLLEPENEAGKLNKSIQTSCKARQGPRTQKVFFLILKMIFHNFCELHCTWLPFLGISKNLKFLFSYCYLFLKNLPCSFLDAPYLYFIPAFHPPNHNSAGNCWQERRWPSRAEIPL